MLDGRSRMALRCRRQPPRRPLPPLDLNLEPRCVVWAGVPESSVRDDGTQPVPITWPLALLASCMLPVICTKPVVYR
jgi:hypothetical protein